jgi:hypothetical protein
MSEAIYDDVTLEIIAEQEQKDLVGQLWQYILALEEYVVRLRNEVNALSDYKRLPYPDPASDFALRFYDHPVYENFSEVLSSEDPEWKIPD